MAMPSEYSQGLCTTTRISNPGILDRLEQDISCFEPYGFRFERQDTNNDIGFVFSQHSVAIPPVVTVQIEVANAGLVASIGPFLRTLVRLCVDPIDPRSLQAIVVIKETKKKHGNDRIRSLAHAIHMLVRNSMGAALFLNLHVIFPTGIHKQAVLRRMNQNDDGCYDYPSVVLHEASERIESTACLTAFSIDLGIVRHRDKSNIPPTITYPIMMNCLDTFDVSQHYLQLSVSTRMCTVRLTPLIYHLSQLLLLGKQLTRQPKSLEQQNDKNSGPILMVCLEKVSNLYRVLMLVRDHGASWDQLIIICRPQDLERFDAETKEFISKNFLCQANAEQSSFPRVLSIEQAREFLVANFNCAPVRGIVGFDLHDHAVTLNKYDSTAQTLLQSAGAVVLGYESDGIPSSITEIITKHVQIESRTSINVVAAFSIVLHICLAE